MSETLSPINFPPTDTLARFDKRRNGSELLPGLLTILHGWLQTNLLLCRATLDLRAWIRLTRRVLRSPDYSRASVQARQPFAARMAETHQAYRRALGQLESANWQDWTSRALIGLFSRALDDFSDLSETCVLGSDAELAELMRGLDDALRNPSQPVL